MNADTKSVKRIIADRRLDADGKPHAFLLKNGNEEITLQPGKAWAQLDLYKWVTRGLIEEPSGFHVLHGGAVQIHGEQINPLDPGGVVRLEEKINQHTESPALKATARAPTKEPPAVVEASSTNKVSFKVRLDKLGHLMVASIHAGERIETGIRGLESFVRNGLMLKPRSIHIDPLLAFVEIDGLRFDSNAAGAAALENRLNTFYAPVLQGNGHAAIEIKANPASPSGFDIHFVTVRAGARFDIKGHLSQENLDILQDQVRCQLLNPGIVLRISPPHLVIRQRRPNGSEDRLSELPDIHYLHVTAAEMQRVLNHPLIRRNGVITPGEVAAPVIKAPPEGEFHTVRNSQKTSLEPTPANYLEPPSTTSSDIPVYQRLAPEQSKLAPIQPVVEESPEEEGISALFHESDPLRINLHIFDRLELCLGIAAQDVYLSLERVFENRRFQVISFTHPDISSIFEIRSEEFVGFYLSHISESRVILDYAFHGKRLEWGAQKCFVQPSLTADSEEFKGSALLGMALVDKHSFAFVVTSAFKEWIKPREKLYEQAGASFITVQHLAAAPQNYPLVWPVP